MTVILENSDILQACATTLAGVLIFITIERKLNVAEIQNTISRLESDIEIAQRKTSESLTKWEYDERKKRLQQLYDRLNEMEQIKEFNWRRAAALKNREDLVTLTTLSLLTSCLLFMILVKEQWAYDVFNYSLVSRLLFSLGLVSLLIRVVFRAID